MEKHYLIPQSKISQIDVDSEHRIVLRINASSIDEFLKEQGNFIEMLNWFDAIINEATYVYKTNGAIPCIRFILDKGRIAGRDIELTDAKYLLDTFIRN